MNNEINLVSGKDLGIEKQIKVLKILKVSAVISLISVASISIIFFIITLILPISKVKKNQDQALVGISKLHKKLTTFSLVTDRIKSINSITRQRKDYPQISAAILSKLPLDASVDAMMLDQNTLIITVTGPSLTSMNQFIDDFAAIANSSNNIQDLIVQSLQYNAGTLMYSLTFQANIL
jgi:hypothetical protein